MRFGAKSRASLIAILAASLLHPKAVRAGDVYVLRFFFGDVRPTGVPCEGYFWQDRLLFHNATSSDQRVRLLGVSNGPMDPNASELLLKPGRSVSVVQDGALTNGETTLLGWFPSISLEPVLFVDHLDVPEGVAVASRIESHQSGSLCTAFPTYSNLSFGLLPLPIYRSLTPAGTPQYHLGTDLGSDGIGLTNPSRVNIGIYNGGSVPANARIELRRSCDEGVIESRAVRIAENAVVQTNGFANDVGGYGSRCIGDQISQTYATVSVDQPSFSYVVTLSNELPPKIPISVSQPN